MRVPRSRVRRDVGPDIAQGVGPDISQDVEPGMGLTSGLTSRLTLGRTGRGDPRGARRQVANRGAGVLRAEELGRPDSAASARRAAAAPVAAPADAGGSGTSRPLSACPRLPDDV